MEVRLKEIRELNDKTQKEIANILDVERGTYAAWECGIDPISTQKIYDLANYYNKSIDYLLEISSNDIEIVCNKKLDLVEIGNNLKYIRNSSNESLRDFSNNININHSTWWGYENGNVLIKLSTLIATSKKYNYSIDWILGRTSDIVRLK